MFSRVYIAEEADGVGDKGSGDNTTVDVWTLEDFSNVSLIPAYFSESSPPPHTVKSKTSSFGTTLLKSQNVRIFKTPANGLKKFYCTIKKHERSCGNP